MLRRSALNWGLLGGLLVSCGDGFGEIGSPTRSDGQPSPLPGEESPRPSGSSGPGFGPNPNGFGSGGSGGGAFVPPSGLTPNADGSYSDARGTRVRVNAAGQLVDSAGNLVVVGADGIVVLANPEVEVETSFRVPVVTGRLIWAANPTSGRVALVDALPPHEVQTLPAGLRPTYLAAIPGGTANQALVINAGGNDATLFQSVGGELRQVDVPLHQNATAWSISDAGRWAIAWSDARDLGQLASENAEGLQDITVIDLSQTPPRPVRLSVGYRPVKVSINAAGTRAYAVTRDGISVIELGDEPQLRDDITIVSPEEVLQGGTGRAVLDDVPITADGRFALVRFAGAPRLKVIALADDTSQLLELPGEVSDVDLAGDGERAVAVIRDTGEVALFSPQAVIADPSQITFRTFSGETLGSVALPDTGDKALLFTNAVDSDRLGILDTTAGDQSSPRVVSLKAPITAVFPSPEGSHAVALLETEASSERAGAFSVIPVGEALPPKIQGTDAPPFRVSLAATTAGLRGLVTTRDDAGGIHAVYLVRMPSLQVDRIALSSPPIAVGLLPDYGVGYVAQQHPEGRITFINLETATEQTLTGFELADRVIGGAAP